MRERAERDEVGDAHAAGEQQHRQQQRVQHRDREIGLERGEDVEQADDDEERQDALREAAQLSPFFTMSIDVQTTTASLPNSDGWKELPKRKRREPLIAARCARGARGRAAASTIVIHMIGHAHSRQLLGVELRGDGERDDPDADAAELLRAR